MQPAKRGWQVPGQPDCQKLLAPLPAKYGVVTGAICNARWRRLRLRDLKETNYLAFLRAVPLFPAMLDQQTKVVAKAKKLVTKRHALTTSSRLVLSLNASNLSEVFGAVTALNAASEYVAGLDHNAEDLRLYRGVLQNFSAVVDKHTLGTIVRAVEELQLACLGCGSSKGRTPDMESAVRVAVEATSVCGS